VAVCEYFAACGRKNLDIGEIFVAEIYHSAVLSRTGNPMVQRPLELLTVLLT